MERMPEMTRQKATLACFAVVLVMTLISQRAGGVPIPFGDQERYFDLSEEPLPQFLEDFFADQNLPVVLSPTLQDVTATLNGVRAGLPQAIWNSVAASNRLIGYYDGAAVYIYPAAERVSRFYGLPPDSVRAFRQALRELRLPDDANSVEISTRNNIVTVSGAPRFAEQVGQLASAMVVGREAPTLAYRYFPLKYAWAADTTLTIGYRELVVPGVATLLQQVANPAAQLTTSTTMRGNRVTAPRLRGSGLAGRDDREPPYARGFDPRRIDYSPPEEPVAAPQATFIPLGDQSRAQIVADPYRNAILVKDKPEVLALYANLIQTLDVEPQLVELEATIIDIDRSRLKELGLNFRLAGSRWEVVFGRDDIKDDFARAMRGRGGRGDIDLLPARSALNAGAIVGDSTLFAARLNALEEDDVIKVVSRPQVITLNDVEAFIESSREIFVPVGGSFEVDLFNVTAGTILRVTPHVIEESDERRRIRLAIAIEDGDVALTTSNTQRVEIPVVSRTGLTTQALIDSGESLLLGGLVRDRSQNRDTGVPGLRRVPILGRIFSDVREERSRTERLFLITPRLVPKNRITEQTAPSSNTFRFEELEG